MRDSEGMRISALAMTVMALTLAGCEREAAPDPAAATSVVGASAGTRPGGASDAASAVLASEGTPVASVSFLIEARPVAGKSFAVKLFLKSATPLQGLQVGIESADLIATPASSSVNIPGGEQPVEHDLAVTAQKAGLWELSVSLQTEGSTAPTLYRIPVLVAAAG